MIPPTTLEGLLRREWLETNGSGGFASSTPIGLNTRRYHGLLFAATRPPIGRTLLLSKYEETLVVDGARYELSANHYGGVTHPQGYRYLTGFRADPFPAATYDAGGVTLTRTIFLIHGEDTVVALYEVVGIGDRECTLEVRPLVAFRDYHTSTHENGALDGRLRSFEGGIAVAPYVGLPTLYFAHNAAVVDEDGFWYRGFSHDVERERGFDDREDLWSPFALQFDLRARGGSAAVIASTAPRRAEDAYTLRDTERTRRTACIPRNKETPGTVERLVGRLTSSSDAYLVGRGTHETVIAGYHWFGDWGRDTMISLPGLALVTGRTDAARSILLAFAEYLSQGMIPNRFPDLGEAPEYNTIDGTLWYFEAVRALLAYTGDYAWVRANLYDRLAEVIRWHIAGTRYDIHVDNDGLLAGGVPGVQLTWMDARVGDRVITPRHGKPVEIQALWYNALRVMERLARGYGDTEREAEYARRATDAHQSFNGLFWNAEANCLYDVIGPDGTPDGAIRPNQVIAAGIAHTMLSQERARRVLATVERELLTPVGLRSLSPRDPAYVGRYEGDGPQRDAAYHQGTVWPWLLGPFITGCVRAGGRSRRARERAAALLDGIATHLDEAGLGHVSEIFDGDPPHAPRGCIAQAWSMAEILRCTVEDVLDRCPTEGDQPCATH